MESYKLVDGLQFKQDTTGLDLYWGKYSYRLVVPFPCIGRVRYYKTVQHFINRLDGPRGAIYWNNPTIYSLRDVIECEGGFVEHLCKFIETRNTLSTDVKTLLTSNHLNLYFNKTAAINQFLDEFDKRSGAIGYFRVKNLAYKSGVVYLSNPRAAWRMYFNLNRPNLETISELDNFVKINSAYPCRTLQRNLHNYRLTKTFVFYIYKNNFIDVADEYNITMFLLQFPNLVSRVCRIQNKLEINTLYGDLEQPNGTDL